MPLYVGIYCRGIPVTAYRIAGCFYCSCCGTEVKVAW